jgi:nitrogen fixation/metabolism regulation signal transduction histidine kinase
MSQTNKKSPDEEIDPVERFRRRRRIVIVLGVITLTLTGTLIYQSSFNVLPLLAPSGTNDILWLYTLSAINFMAFVVFVMVLGRNVLKLMRERATQQIGARFKVRLVLFSIGISLLPLIFLFFFSYGLINRSIDKWFSLPAQRAVEDAKDIQEQYEKRESNLLQITATEVAQQIDESTQDWGAPAWADNLLEHAGKPKPVYLWVTRGGKEFNTAAAVLSNYGPDVSSHVAFAQQEIRAGNEYVREVRINDSRLCFIASGTDNETRVLLVREIPSDFAAKLAAISEYNDQYKRLTSQARNYRRLSILQLGSITVLLLFSAMWFALYVARGITEPIADLVEATDKVARGNLDYRVKGYAKGELALLVASFNQMASDLLANREQINKSTAELRDINLALEERRRYIETILQSLSTGVISLNSSERLTTINDRAISLLQLGERPAAGTPLSDFFGSANYVWVSRLIRQAKRVGSITREIELERSDGSILPTATSITPLKGSDRQYQGTVIMIEDMTELIKAQRSAAWSEVARRMAHEIKNPLTPIQLSAERIARRFKRDTGELNLEKIEPVITEGTATIIREVDALKRMVDEFSKFARLPKAKPAPTILNDVVNNTIALYADRTNGIVINEKLDPNIPELNLDADQFKQVLVNLIDNAIEAISETEKTGNITIETRHNQNEGKSRLIVSDTGMGVKASDRDKLFLPYFSTKRRDTGLGLAIVNHIVVEHGGTIFVEDNKPKGARFVVELPS